MNLTPAKMDAGLVLKYTDQWRRDAWQLDCDRAELSRHFNGGALEPADDMTGGKPPIRRPNILLGFKFLERPYMQLLSTYDEGLGLLDIKVCTPSLPPTRRILVENHLNRVVNEVVQYSERLLHPYKANCGEAVINGISTLYMDDPYDWAPKFGRPYFPWNAPSDVTNDKFADWCFLGELNLSDILARLDRLKKVSEPDSYWDKKQLGEIAERIAKRHINEQDPWMPIQYDDPISWREWIQTQAWGATALATSCPVVWYFCKRFDQEYRRPVDLYCVPRWGEVAKPFDQWGASARLDISRPSGDQAGVLFYQPEVFEDVLDCFFPFQISCMIGGEPMMRRNMGLGALMYDLDIRVQTSVNNMFDGSDFDFAPLFQAADGQSEAELQELAATGIRPYQILPQGARFADKPKGTRPYSSIFELTQLMSSEMGAQAQAFHGGGEFENKGRAELEVQVLERKQQLATALRMRMGDFIRRGDPLCRAIGNVLINAELLECDMAWKQREDIRQRMEEVGVAWEEFAGYCKFTMRRPPGHGDPALAISRAQQTEMICRGIGPQAHRQAQRNLLAAINGGDTQLAAELVPEQGEKQGQQETNAMAQSATCLTTFMPAPVLPEDNPMAHVPIHMAVLQSHFTNALQSGKRWTVESQRGWEALAAHAIADIRTLGSFNPDLAKKAEQGIIQMTRAANQFEISALPGAVDPVEQAKLQLSIQEQQRKDAKTKDDIEHRRVSQEHREEAAEFQQNLQLAQLSNSEKDSEVKRATSLVSTASKVAVDSQPEPAPTAAQ